MLRKTLFACLFVAIPLIFARDTHASTTWPEIGASNSTYACVIINGRVYCWGDGYYRLGRGNGFGYGFFQMVRGLPASAHRIAVGYENTCAIVNGNGLFCWGDNLSGQMLQPPGVHPYALEAQPMPGFGPDVSRVAVGLRFICAVKSSGALYCWGDNTYGQIGVGYDGGSVSSPYEVFSSGVSDVAAGESHVCAIRFGTVYCWGRNTVGQLGLGYVSSGLVATPTAVSSLPGVANKIAASYHTTCAIVSLSNTLYCWGDNINYQVGVPGSPRFFSPQMVMQNVEDVSIGTMSCAKLIGDGRLRCWGVNYHGQIYIVGPSNYTSPAPENYFHSNGLTVLLASGWAHVAALASDGCVYTWGRNIYGELGRLPITETIDYPPRVVPGSCINGTGFTKIAPAHNSSGYGRDVVLSWTPPPGQHINHYHYFITGTTGVISDIVAGTATTVAVSGLSGSMNYSWQIRACADLDCTIFTDANNGGTWMFSTVALPPNFGKINPATGTLLNVSSATLSWQPISGVNHYRYCYALWSSPPCTPATTTGLSTSVNIGGLAWGERYRWQVRACATTHCDLYTDADGGVQWQFFVAPTSFNKNAPFDGSVDQPTGVTLSWGASSPLNHYRYCYSSSPGCTPGIAVSGGNSVTIGSLAHGQPYYWQVRACANISCTIYRDADNGTHWSFVTMPPNPSAFVKISPVDYSAGHGVSVTLSWSTSGGATHYRICLRPDDGSVCNLAAAPIVSYTSWISGPLQPGVTYFWQVRACANAGCSAYTDANGGAGWRFTVARTPLSPLKKFPVDGASGLPASIVLNWEHEPAGIHHYRYCYTTSSACTPALPNGVLTEAHISGLTAGAVYTWQVRACADIGCSIYADADAGMSWRFAIASRPSHFSKTHPISGSVIGNAVVLSWTASTPAQSYRICVDSSLNGICDGAFSVVSGTQQSIYIGGLLPASTYEWQVLSCADPGCTINQSADGGAYHRFSTYAITGILSKSSPAHGTIITTTTIPLSWTSSLSGLHHYRYCLLSTSSPPCTPNISVGTYTSMSISGLSPGASYRWQVRGCADATCSIYHDADHGHYEFFVASAPFLKISPVQGAVVDPPSVMATWTASAGAVKYQYCLWKSGNPPCATQLDASSNTAWLTSLSPGGYYHWQVFACADAACTIRRTANEGITGSFRVRSPVEVISSYVSLQKSLIDSPAFLGRPLRYRIAISNPLSTTLAFTLSEYLPNRSAFVFQQNTPNATPHGTLMWHVSLPPLGRAVITPTIVYSTAIPAVIADRIVTPSVVISDNFSSYTYNLSHSVFANRLFVPFVDNRIIYNINPDIYEADDQPNNAKQLLLGSTQNRTFHHIGEVDYISGTLYYIGVQTYVIEINVELWPPGVKYELQSPNSAFNPVSGTFTLTSGLQNFRIRRDIGNVMQRVDFMLMLDRRSVPPPSLGKYTLRLYRAQPLASTFNSPPRFEEQTGTTSDITVTVTK